jgi:DNA polymerase (family 10)
MTNREIADLFSQTASLMELHLENEFKSKALRNAAFTISRLEKQISDMDSDELSSIKGIGKSLAAKIVTASTTGTLEELEELTTKTPIGVIELLDVKGLGPKKVAALWRGLEIQSPGELLYACNENRLVTLKGFGEKTQFEIKQNLEYLASHKGYFHFAKAEAFFLDFQNKLKEKGFEGELIPVGDFRRCCEVIKEIRVIAELSFSQAIDLGELIMTQGFEFNQIGARDFEIRCANSPVISLGIFDAITGYEYFIETGPKQHVDLVVSRLDGSSGLSDEQSVYEKAGLAFVEPEMRDLEDCFNVKHLLAADSLVNVSDLKGCLHNHTTYSDGASTLREMADACISNGLQYLAICDHSRSAFYAGGLSIEHVSKQHAEIDTLNAELFPFRIFKGIESDILSDGSLDYPDEVLKTFEVVVASVHSGLSMTEEKATERIIKAVENPFTTILGHPTGRLLLSRKGYPLNHRKVIEACASNGVAIELNAHPYRLDIDWRFLQLAMELGVPISINPDAHHTNGINDMRYGVLVARKAGVPASAVLNSKSLSQFESWLGLC